MLAARIYIGNFNSYATKSLIDTLTRRVARPAQLRLIVRLALAARLEILLEHGQHLTWPSGPCGLPASRAP